MPQVFISNAITGWFCFGLCQKRKAKDSDKVEMKPLYGKYSKLDEE